MKSNGCNWLSLAMATDSHLTHHQHQLHQHHHNQHNHHQLHQQPQQTEILIQDILTSEPETSVQPEIIHSTSSISVAATSAVDVVQQSVANVNNRCRNVATTNRSAAPNRTHQANLAAALHDHLSCTKLISGGQLALHQFQMLDQHSLPKHLRKEQQTDEKTRRELATQREHVQSLNEMILVQLDLIQHQQEQLLKKDRQLQGLWQDREMLCARIGRMERELDTFKATTIKLNSVTTSSLNATDQTSSSTVDQLDQHPVATGSMPPKPSNGSPLASFAFPSSALSNLNQVDAALSPISAVDAFVANCSNCTLLKEKLDSAMKSKSRSRKRPTTNNTTALASETTAIQAKDSNETKLKPVNASKTPIKLMTSTVRDRFGVVKCKMINNGTVGNSNKLKEPTEPTPNKDKSDSVKSDQQQTTTGNNRTKSREKTISKIKEVLLSNEGKPELVISECSTGKLSTAKRRKLSKSSIPGVLAKKTLEAISTPEEPMSIEESLATSSALLNVIRLMETDFAYEIITNQDNGDSSDETSAFDSSAINPSKESIVEQMETSFKPSIEIPSWRIHPISSCYSLEGTENLNDEVFNRRHAKFEIDEKRRKRWDMQRLREQRLNERLRSGRYYGGTTFQTTFPSSQTTVHSNLSKALQPTNDASQQSNGQTNSFYPEPKDIQFIEVSDTLPVVAFGHPIPLLPEAKFSLPWLPTSKSSSPQSNSDQRCPPNSLKSSVKR